MSLRNSMSSLSNHGCEALRFGYAVFFSVKYLLYVLSIISSNVNATSLGSLNFIPSHYLSDRSSFKNRQRVALVHRHSFKGIGSLSKSAGTVEKPEKIGLGSGVTTPKAPKIASLRSSHAFTKMSLIQDW